MSEHSTRNHHASRRTARRQPAVFVLCVLLIYGAGQITSAQEPTPPTNEPAQQVAEQALAEARLYSFQLGNGQPVVLNERPILKWSNTYAAPSYGSVFVWTQEDRPVVIGSMYRIPSGKPTINDEFLSLHTAPMEASRRDQPIWHPPAGVTFQPLKDVPAPAASARARLPQMREMARTFSAELTTISKVKHQLRLLSQPLYRYEGNSRDLTDGAIFAFTRETDPDVLLLLEAGGGEQPQWQYALARMHVGALRAWYRDTEVWSVEEMAYPYARPNGPYTLLTDLPLPDVGETEKVEGRR